MFPVGLYTPYLVPRAASPVRPGHATVLRLHQGLQGQASEAVSRSTNRITRRSQTVNMYGCTAKHSTVATAVHVDAEATALNTFDAEIIVLILDTEPTAWVPDAETTALHVTLRLIKAPALRA